MKNIIYFCDEKELWKNIIKEILLIVLLISFYNNSKIKKWKEIDNLINNDIISNVDDFINNLNNYSVYRKPKYILLFDYVSSPFCEDFNAYTIFQYYQENEINNAYYVLNEGTELYNYLLRQGKMKNIIPYKNNKHNNHLFPFLLNSKIIIQSYALFFFQKIVSHVKYLKFLYICHAVNYFKTSIIKIQLLKLVKNKQNIIVSSPYEYNLYKKMNLYDEKSMIKGGLARYDRFNYINKSLPKKKCILISFTYRSFNKEIYNKSLFRKNTYRLLNDKSLKLFLSNKSIDLIFIHHHHDVRRGIIINRNISNKIKFLSQKFLSNYIEQCSLFITDFSSISFDFMFQNKPVLFYHLDKKDKFKFKEKSFMKIDYNNSIYFNNIFSKQDKLINKIKYYVNRNFILESGLSEKYNTMFYTKTNITPKIIKIINNLIKNV